MLELYGRTNSINVQKVIWALEELGIDYTRHDVGGAFGGLDTPDYLAMNPTGLIPTLRDGDRVLWESNSILRWLGATHPGAIWPVEPYQRARLDRWMDWQVDQLWAPMKPIFFHTYRLPPEERDPAVVAAAIETCSARLDVLETHLADRSHIGGEGFTLADIPLGITCYRWFAMPIERPKTHANVRAWHDRLAARPAWQKHIALPLS